MSACPTGCGRSVRAGHLMCGPCWSLVPGPIQKAVYRTWRAFNAGTGEWEPYATAREAAIASVP